MYDEAIKNRNRKLKSFRKGEFYFGKGPNLMSFLFFLFGAKMVLILHFRLIANWCVLYFPSQNNWVMSFSVHSWTPSTCEGAERSAGFPSSRFWPRVFPGNWSVSAWAQELVGLPSLWVSPCASCRTRTIKPKGSSSPLDAIAFSLLFSLGFIAHSLYDKSYEDGCHHLATPGRQGLIFPHAFLRGFVG